MQKCIVVKRENVEIKFFGSSKSIVYTVIQSRTVIKWKELPSNEFYIRVELPKLILSEIFEFSEVIHWWRESFQNDWYRINDLIDFLKVFFGLLNSKRKSLRIAIVRSNTHILYTINNCELRSIFSIFFIFRSQEENNKL